MISRSIERFGLVLFLACFACAAPLFFSACGGGSSGDDDDVSSAFDRNIDLYNEVPPIYVTGNIVNGQALRFYPKGSVQSGYCDTDGDGVEDTKINDLNSFCNAANNIFRAEIAACKAHGASQRDLYADADVWNTILERPDTMQSDANITGTQFIKVKFPFKLSRASVFDPNNTTNNLLTGQITLRDQIGITHPCSVFLNGLDANGVDRSADPNFPAGAKPVAEDTLVFVALAANQDPPGLPTVPTAFTAEEGVPDEWTQQELRLKVGTLADHKGRAVTIDSTHLIRSSAVVAGEDGVPVQIQEEGGILPSSYEYNPFSNPNDPDPLVDPWPEDPPPATPRLVVPPDVNFQIIFNKPVIPETVGRSIVFNRAPFTGNMKPIPNPEQGPSPDPACDGSVYPLCPNIAVRAYFLDANGIVVPGVQTPIPFRVYPLHQNNMAKYIVNPLIDLPGSTTDWVGLPNQPASPGVDDLRMRIDIIVYEYQTNTFTGNVNDPLSPGPQNLGVADFHGERFYYGGANYVATFSILRGKRYVNAPVSPNVMYYTMGTEGIGAIDLCGSGFNTNAPSTEVTMWVTNTAMVPGFYNQYGNGMLNQGNPYTYPVGLGRWTPVPGVNEGSSGWWRDMVPEKDALVRDSNGDGRLFPDPDSDVSSVSISDVEVGDFLDVIYFDKSNPYASLQNHLDLIYTTAPGNFLNNMISAPPTPNPPPLTIPVGMQPVDVVVDEFSILREGALVIMGKEVFPPDLLAIPLAGPKFWVHLDPAGLQGGADTPFPPNPPGLGPWGAGTFLQDGPLGQTNTFRIGYTYASRQQIGNFLFAADKANNRIRVLNSNSMDEITTIQDGVRGPDNLAVSPDLRTLYVTNSAAGNVGIYNVNPRDANFLTLKDKVQVGVQPKGIGAQPDGEDIFVCNWGSNSISIINPATRTVRKTLSALINKPYDIVAAPRQNSSLGLGWGTDVFHAYISNYGGNNVLIYESGPDGLGGVGYDDILDPVPSTGESGQQFLEILRPRGMCYNPLYLNDGTTATELTGGVFVAHSSSKGAAVSRVSFIDQYAPWGPVQITPISGSIGGTPGFGQRAFLIEAQWTAQDGYLSGFDDATDVAVSDINRFAYLYQNLASPSNGGLNWGAVGNNPNQNLPMNNKHPIRIIGGAATPTYFPDLLFVSHSTTRSIDVIEITSGDVWVIDNLPAAATRLKTYFKN